MRIKLLSKMAVGFLTFFMISAAEAGIPLWTYTPLTATTLEVPDTGTATVQYRVQNQSNKAKRLVLTPPTPGVQLTAPCTLNPRGLSGDTCILNLLITGSALPAAGITGGPLLCQANPNGSPNPSQCYQPSSAHILRITKGGTPPPQTIATITVIDSPLTLTVNGVTGQLTINNTSTQVTATNITSNFTGTALDGNVSETGNTCAIVAPGGSCTLTYTPGNTVVPQTNFTIQGTNTNAVTAAIAIQSGSTLTGITPTAGTASGGTSFTLTGTGLTGTTGVTFDGIAATSVNVVNSTTVTGVTPAHAVGVVDVVIDTPAGGATLANGYTYVVVGQPAGGGTIACLNGGLNNLIAATADNSTSIQWGGSGTVIGAGAQSTTDGASNTAAIVADLTGNQGIPINNYAAGLCSNYEVDSQGNTPCQAGNTCYNDWFLPAGNNTTGSGQLNCLFANRVAISGFAGNRYWSSTEDSSIIARGQDFSNGFQINDFKNFNLRVRCVRAFAP